MSCEFITSLRLSLVQRETLVKVIALVGQKINPWHDSLPPFTKDSVMGILLKTGSRKLVEDFFVEAVVQLTQPWTSER